MAKLSIGFRGRLVILALAGKSLPDTPLFESMRSSDGRRVVELPGLDGVQRIYAIETLKAGDTVLYATVGFATDVVYAPSRAALVRGLLAAAAAALAAYVVGRLLGDWLILRSVRALSMGVKRVSGGDLTAKVHVESSDEMGVVAAGFNDMTAKIAERESALRASEARYRQVVDLMQEAVWIHTDGKVIFANPAAARLFGASGADELIGRPSIGWVHADDQGKAAARTRKLTAGPCTVPVTEMRLVRLDGKVRIAAICAVSFLQDGKIHVMASARDVTALREAESQLHQAQKMESVGQLTGGVAHDFNNLLTVVIGGLDLALGRVQVELRPVVESSLRAAERGAALVRQMLAFSRRQTLSPETLGFNELAAGMKDLLQQTLGEDIEIEMKLMPELWPALADRTQVESALLNLAINSRDAMPNGGKLTSRQATATSMKTMRLTTQKSRRATTSCSR